jgi:hypothetical protein
MRQQTRISGRSRQSRVEREINKFNGGVNRLLEEARIGFNEAKEATNLMQVQDGLWKPRWGSDYFGATHAASIDGAAEYMASSGVTELITIANGKAWKSTNGGSLTEITGATFTAGIQCFFIQIGGYLYIANGTDSLARYNGSVLTTYSELSAPTGLNGTRTGLASGIYNLYAEVTALNAVGETVGSTEASLANGMSKPRDQWAASDSVTWAWNAVASATGYQLYISETAGNETLLASSTASTYRDDGTVALNPYVEPPLSNTTSAPKFKSMEISGNRIWATHDVNNPYTVYFSGTGQFIGNFSDFYGGGWINLEKGGRERPTRVIHYQSGTGDGRATVLCSTPEGKGAVWQITISSATVGDSTFSVPAAGKVVGSSGTDSQLSVVADNNNIWFFNRRGIFTLGPEKNYYGILRTNELSSRIRPYIRGLIGSQINKVCSYFYDAKVFFSVPTSASGNNRIIYYDTERLNWVVDWSIGAKQFLEYTDTGGVTHFLYVPVSGTKLIELSPNIQGDLGEAFSTTYTSGRWPLRQLWKDFLKLKKVYVKLGNPRGSVNFEVLGSTKSEGFSSAGTATITSQYALTGMGFDLMGNVKMGDTLGVPTTFSDSSDPRYIKLNKKLRDIQLRLTTNSIDADYTLQSFIFEGNELKTNPPSGWKLSN